ncbi:breast cancer type 1 susceptibility protein isoform X2 [Hyla sarda]|uniref:breast cancer type 1 susceptibility protein isoform X2 n=1 Tax=Hyla sarda TaxID=327740 RepID=UPI0024C26E93|nr:breast cancer type 1 susceptibility protein isoform X2 [Hyla sarda]
MDAWSECLDLMKEPVATRCDHIFCRFCMLQLLSRKKKSRVQCPMCKKEVTKRSLQDSPRFKLLVDGLLKIINAFELDSGYKFFPSQDYASTVTANNKEAPKKDEQAVVQSTGHRRRTKRGIVNGGYREDHLSLLKNVPDAQPPRDADTRNREQPKHQNNGIKELIADFVSDSSEDDLFKKAGSLGSDVDGPSTPCEPKVSLEPEEEEDSLMGNEANDQVSSKLESEDVVASDLAEYGFSEKDLDSIRSNLWSIDGIGVLKESPSEESAVDRDFCERVAERSTLVKPDENVRSSNLAALNSSMQIERQQYTESQTSKIALDSEYDRDDSFPENMGSTQGSPRDAPCAVSRERLKKSIKRVTEWFLKTDELLNNGSPNNDELVPDVSRVEDQEVSEKGSSVTEETEIMAVSHLHAVADAVEKSMVSVEEKIFGRVYKREKKQSLVSKVTCVADIHMDGFNETVKVNEVSKTASLKPKRSTGLQPEHFIKKVDAKEQCADDIASYPVVVDDFGLDTEDNSIKEPNMVSSDAEKMEFVGQGSEKISDAQINKPEKQKKSSKRKSEKTKVMQALHMAKGADATSCRQQSPLHSSKVQIDSYSSSEPGNEVNQKNVRRSRRLNLSKENETDKTMNSKDIKACGLQIEDPQRDATTQISYKEPCPLTLEVNGPQITSKSPIAVQNGTGIQNESSHIECDSVHVTEETGKGSSPVPVKNVAEIEDSDLDTQLLLKTFKSAKRMSFKLDPVCDSANKENCHPMDISDIGTNLNGQRDEDPGQPSSLCQPNEDVHFTSKQRSVQENKPKQSRSLRSKKSYRLSSEHAGKSSAENTDNLTVHMTKTITTNGQLNDLNPIKDVEPLETCNHTRNAAASKSEGLPLCSKTESMSLFDVVTHQNPSAARRGDTRSGIGQGENEHAKNSSYQKCSFDEEQVTQITSSNSSQGSLTGKLLGHLASHNSSPCKSPEVYSDTPDGLLGSVDRLGEDASCCGAVAEKSFVFEDGKKSKLVDYSLSPFSQSQVVRTRKRRTQKLDSLEGYSEKADGLLGSVDRLGEGTSCCAEKSSVIEDGKKSKLIDHSPSPVSQSQVVRSRKRRAQKIESSEEESSGDEELPCLNAIFGIEPITDLKNASASSSPKQQGGGVLTMFSSCSTSGKTQTSFNLPHENFVGSQESQCSVNLFSSQSNTSDHSVTGATDNGKRNGTRNQERPQESSPKRTKVSNNEEELANVENDEEMTNVENEDQCQEHNLGEVSGCESEASHTGDSSGLSSQCEILTSQQRDTMRNNLDKLQKEMAALEAVLEQHGSQSPASRRGRASAVEHVTIRPQEAPEKAADSETYRSPDAIPETEVTSEQGRASGRQIIEQPLPLGSRSRSPTPPLSPPRATSRKETPEKIRTAFNLLKELKESTLMEDESEGQKDEDLLHTHQSDHCAPTATNLKNSKSPKRSLGSKAQEVNGHSMLRRGSARQSTEMEGVVRTPQYPTRRPGNTQRSASPTFESPLRSKFAPSFKSPVVSAQRNFSLVTSGLSQSEVMLVQKFARKTKSIFYSQLTESTSHVIIKTDEQLVCERTLKYFMGVAGRKWVVSYEWIVQSFREGRILDEYDFEVKGDVINGRNHRGPRRSRLGSDGLLLTDFEICCLGSFKDMTRDDLEQMVSLCGASVAQDPSRFEHRLGTTCLVVVQPDKETDYAALRKKYRCLPITREWVLDSVSSYKLQAFDGYLV